ncbi:hypothetical protein TruAng_001230 [Truncatella angustata]|nr:hypothetical protein TruAng_001230 [Truncatella angustata]
MSPVPTSSLSVRTATLTARADAATTTAIDWGQQFAFPPTSKSLPFWVAIFIVAPAILVMVGWMVWECKFGSDGNDDVLKALREKQKEANRKPAKIKPGQISPPKPKK